MLQKERLQEVYKILSQIWSEMKEGYVDDTYLWLQEAVYCQVNINRIVFVGNEHYLEDRIENWGRGDIYEYRLPVPNKYIHTIDNGEKMLKCPKCDCGIIASAFSYAVGNCGYKFCPYCGEDLRIQENETHKQAYRQTMDGIISNHEGG